MPRLIILAALALCMGARAGAVVAYVAADAPGPVHNGSSWATAFTTITSAINSITYGGDIWIKAGTYRECVTAKNYINLCGGFLGCETAVSQRIPGAFPTVIDAGRGGSAVNIPAQAYVTLDGLTTRHGKALYGGGISCGTNSTVNIRNCRVEDCHAIYAGGGVYYGKYTRGEMSDCFITRCTAPNGGGGAVEYHAYPTWRGVVIARNHATTGGGGLYCPFHSGADLANCTLVFNTAGATGGAAHSYGSGSATINYSIISGNSAPVGGGIYGEVADGQVTFTHCDFWQNSDGDWAGMVPTPAPFAGNFSSDPIFAMPGHDEYHLLPGSQCEEVGAFPLEQACRIDRIGVAKMLADGARVQLCGKLVSCVDSDTTYLQEPDRASAIAAMGLTGCTRGDIIASITGTLTTNALGARVLNASSSTTHQYDLAPKALATRLSWLPSATGLYTRTWGFVTALSDTGLTLTDGSTYFTVRCTPTGVAIGDLVSVTGVYTVNGDFIASEVRATLRQVLPGSR